MWWNWQTHRTQNPAVVIPCGFKSHRRHQTKNTNLLFFRSVRIFYIRLIFFTGDKIHGLATNLDNGTKLAYEYRH